MTPAQVKELENLLNRLESITLRLEKALPLLEKGAEALGKSIALTKSLEDLLDEHLTPTEKENLQLIINSQGSEAKEESEGKENSEEKVGFIIISPDSSADFEELSEKDLIFIEEEDVVPESDKGQNASDKSENSSNSQNTVVIRVVEGLESEREDKEKAEEEEEEEEEEELEKDILDEVTEREEDKNLEKSDREKLEMTNSKWCDA